MGKKKQHLVQTYLNTALTAATTPLNSISKPAVAKATLTTDLKHHGIILQKHSIIKDLYALSGPNAKGNEFQMHYWMLVFRHQFEDEGFFDIAVPTCYFNYEQFVTGAHVDFEMKDVSDLSAKLTPLHNMISNQILATDFKARLEAIFGLSFEPLSVDVGTIHRHPGSSYSQRFSGTDLDANETHHGIVFPLRSGIDKPSFSGILAIDSTECNVAHYEYRIVNGSYDAKDLSYVKGRCLSITENNTYVAPTITAVQRFFGQTVTTPVLKTKEDASLIPLDVIQELERLISILPDPNTQCVRSEHVKVKPYVSTIYGGGWNKPYEQTAPYKLKFGEYSYSLSILLANLEKHYDYHKISYVSADLRKSSLTEIEARLTTVYALPEPQTKTTASAKPASETPSAFVSCPIKIMTDAETAAATKEELANHYDALDAYYYGRASEPILTSEPVITKAELIDYIIELYLNIYDEEQEVSNGFNFNSYEDFIG